MYSLIFSSALPSPSNTRVVLYKSLPRHGYVKLPQEKNNCYQSEYESAGEGLKQVGKAFDGWCAILTRHSIQAASSHFIGQPVWFAQFFLFL